MKTGPGVAPPAQPLTKAERLYALPASLKNFSIRLNAF